MKEATLRYMRPIPLHSAAPTAASLPHFPTLFGVCFSAQSALAFPCIDDTYSTYRRRAAKESATQKRGAGRGRSRSIFGFDFDFRVPARVRIPRSLS